ncbi:MFS transporter [Oleiagrimonas sp. C23AA]|uniref:MFS transporter n=1 Tax=Oleiagrimonas sp. C23AA TaxID=2719047 RepID=UPI00141FBFD1|nr:MFS transporter [Oleiagrimonas sp. C23AA]NII09252.1 MFS transporter [Oleiagrimonas sp. C23AA]
MDGSSAAGSASTHIEHGTRLFWRANLALFLAGFCNFGLMYDVQPLLPEFSRDFHLSPTAASLSLSLTTGVLAFAMLIGGAVSDAFGRKRVMLVSLLVSAALTLVLSAMPSWHGMLVLRALMGLSLCGVPAVAMAYVSEEMHVRSVGLAMGLYIGGTAVGGMGGRLITGVLTDLVGWRLALAAMGVVGVLAALAFWRILPASRHFTARRLRPAALGRAFVGLLGDRGLPWLFAEGFVLMGAFVTVYNYIGYRLLAPPYGLSQSAVGMIFAVYLVGIFSSTWMGHLANRLGRRRVLWSAFAISLAGIGLTACVSLWAIVLGMAVLTFGFFAGHSIVASWVGRRATHSKAQASSLYLFAYYMGSSVAGSLGGQFWATRGWHGVAVFTACLSLAGLLMALRLTRLAPLPGNAPAAA